ncbi:hypothetical protein HanRHA438_Chr01g0032881 [Helianthus annuus]|nr:hypothetical protein HanRHA438_Chr01g0032881 [Helianthus annuus]
MFVSSMKSNTSSPSFDSFSSQLGVKLGLQSPFVVLGSINENPCGHSQLGRLLSRMHTLFSPHALLSLLVHMFSGTNHATSQLVVSVPFFG